MNPRELLKSLAGFPWYPLLIALLPLARFHEANFRAYLPGAYVRLGVLYLLTAGVLLVLGAIVWKSRHRAALVTAPVVAVLVYGADMGGWVSGGLLLVAAGFGVLFSIRSLDPARSSIPLSTVFLVLLLLPIVTTWWTDRGEPGPQTTPLFDQPLPLGVEEGAEKPDIWFLLVDGLGSPAYVESMFGLGPDRYSGQLRRRGFQVLDKSYANYQQTGLSLAATWNVAHIQDLLTFPDENTRDRRPLGELMGNSRVMRAIRELGYAVVDVPSSYPMTHLHRPDARLAPVPSPSLVEFAVLEKGVLPLVHGVLGKGPSDMSFALRRRNLQFIFDHLPDARREVPADRPAFVFTHILAPHPPFVFDAVGGARASEYPFEFADGSHWLDKQGWAAGRYPEKYRDQAMYVMAKVGAAIDRILEEAVRPTVIIVQGDHGPGSRLDWERPERTDHLERFGIFNGWYLPPEYEGTLPEGVSAINTFPILFNVVFGARVPLQPERNLISRWSAPYVFMEIRD